MPQAMLPQAAPMGPSSLAASLGAPMSPLVQYTITKAMSEVRGCDKRGRQLAMIEIAAKQLALQIAEYEESIAEEDAAPRGQSVLDDGPT
ncbi:hypothetical protein P8C59_000357 [Phyllachora maydis]|uniref:Uncharacterized protein n=1 Tax=Phyllachora maydis TaxID=1825666 RepID=A0AAD9HW40_9PEZI|nr:hypothetical protein P8C59_000357 [Phyllachora maydis]